MLHWLLEVRLAIGWWGIVLHHFLVTVVSLFILLFYHLSDIRACILIMMLFDLIVSVRDGLVFGSFVVMLLLLLLSFIHKHLLCFISPCIPFLYDHLIDVALDLSSQEISQAKV